MSCKKNRVISCNDIHAHHNIHGMYCACAAFNTNILSYFFLITSKKLYPRLPKFQKSLLLQLISFSTLRINKSSKEVAWQVFYKSSKKKPWRRTILFEIGVEHIWLIFLQYEMKRRCQNFDCDHILSYCWKVLSIAKMKWVFRTVSENWYLLQQVITICQNVSTSYPNMAFLWDRLRSACIL